MAIMRSPSFRLSANLAMLRIAAELNTLDNPDGTTPNPINYMIDADIFGMFVESPSEKRSKQFDDSNGLRILDNPSFGDSLLLADYQTAEYIFSGKLPGQVGSKVYLAESHWKEIERMKFAILGRNPGKSTDPIFSGSASNKTSDLNAFSRLIERQTSGGIIGRSVKKLCQQASELTQRILESPYEGANDDLNRWLSIVIAAQRAIRRCSSAHQIAQYTDLTGDKTAAREKINEWCLRLTCARQGHRYPGYLASIDAYNNFPIRIREGIQNDARAIVDLITMNEASRDANKIVMISGTRSIHWAYTVWYLEQKESMAETAYDLRHPLQYTPLLNLTNLSALYDLGIDSQDARTSFEQISSSLNEYFSVHSNISSFKAALLQTIPERMRPESATKIKARPGILDAQELAERWSVAFGSSCLLTLPVVAARSKTQDKVLRSILRRVGGSLIGLQNEIIGDLEMDSMYNSLYNLGVSLRGELARTADRPAWMVVARVVLPVIGGLDQTYEKRLLSLLHGPLELIASESLRFVGDRMKARDQSVAHTVDPTDIVWSVVLSLALGGWRQAKRLAEQGMSLLRRQRGLDQVRSRALQAVMRELDFLRALAIRFDCASPQEYQLAMRSFDSAAASEQEGSAFTARALIERGTLRLVGALRRSTAELLGSSLIWPKMVELNRSTSSSDDLNTCIDDFRSALSRLNYGEGIERTHGEGCLRLAQQAAANNLATVVLMHVMGLPVDVEAEHISRSVQLVDQAYESGRVLRPIAVVSFEAYRAIFTERHSDADHGMSDVLMFLYSASQDPLDSVNRKLIADIDLDMARLVCDSGTVSFGVA